MLTEEDFNWYEENSLRGKNGRDAVSDSRTWKLHLDKWDFDDGDQNKYKSDINCWKRKRKNQYRMKKVHAVKDSKQKDREHWRFRNVNHTYSSRRYSSWRRAKQELINSENMVRKEFSAKFLQSLLTGDYISERMNRYAKITGVIYKVLERYYLSDADDSICVTVKQHRIFKGDHCWSDDPKDDYSKLFYLDVEGVGKKHFRNRFYRVDETWSNDR